MKKFKDLTEGLSHKVPVYHADRKTLVGHVNSGATSIGAAKLAKKKSASFERVNGVYSWVASDNLKESKYGDAMSSRLPAHLPDPRLAHLDADDKVEKSWVKAERARSKRTKKDPKNPTWKLYREEAKRQIDGMVLVESTELNIPEHTVEEIANKHGFTTQHIQAQLEKGIKVEGEHTTHMAPAREIALDHLWENPNYYTILKKAQLEGCLLEEGLTPRERMSGDERLKPVKPAPVDHTEDQNKAPKTQFSYKKFAADRTKHPEKFIAGLTEGSDLPFHKYTNDELVAAIKHHADSATELRRFDRKSHAAYQHVQHAHAAREILKSRKRDLRNYGMDEAYDMAFNESGSEGYKVGDKVIPKIGPHKGTVHTVIHVHPTGHLNIKPNVHVRSNRYHLGAAKADPKDVDRAPLSEEYSQGMYFHAAVKHAKTHGNRVTFGTLSKKWHSIDPKDRDYHTSFALDPDEAKRQGEAHSFLQSTGARHLEESTLLAGREEKPLGPEKGRKPLVQGQWLKNRGKQFKKWPEGMHTTNTGINRKTIQEIFQAAKDKKDGKPSKQDNLPNDGANEPNKEIPGAGAPGVHPQDAKGPQDGAPGSDTKKDNTPVPENASKSKKLQVKGAGPDDQFQADPQVTPLTHMPDTGNPRNGSAATR